MIRRGSVDREMLQRDCRNVEALILLPVLGAFAIGAMSGRLGFAASPLLLPLLGEMFGYAQAAQLLTLALLVANVPVFASGFQYIRWRPLVAALVIVLPFAASGALLFALMANEWRLILFALGFVLLAFIAVRSGKWWPATVQPPLGCATAGLFSGFAGSSGPLAVALSRSPKFASPEAAATLSAAAIVTHSVKLGVYEVVIPGEPAFYSLAIAMGAALAIGAGISNRLAERVSASGVRNALPVLLLIGAIHMFAIGARQLWGA